MQQVGGWISRAIFFLEGPFWTAVFVGLAASYLLPHHPLARGVLLVVTLVMVVVGWSMTYCALWEWKDEQTDAGRAG